MRRLEVCSGIVIRPKSWFLSIFFGHADVYPACLTKVYGGYKPKEFINVFSSKIFI